MMNWKVTCKSIADITCGVMWNYGNTDKMQKSVWTDIKQCRELYASFRLSAFELSIIEQFGVWMVENIQTNDKKAMFYDYEFLPALVSEYIEKDEYTNNFLPAYKAMVRDIEEYAESLK